MQRKYFGTTSNGVPVHIFQLESAAGVVVEVMEYGASVVSIALPDATGGKEQVVVGFPEFAPYETSSTPFGATLGRYGGRISDAAFFLNGSLHGVAGAADKIHHENGGEAGLQRAVWWGEALNEGVRFHCTSPDLDEGFPGAVDCTVEYRLDDDGTLWMGYRASADVPTVVDLSNQIYFNLRDGGRSPIGDHDLWIDANEAVELDRDGAPTGHLYPLEGSALDLCTPGEVDGLVRAWDGSEMTFDPTFVLSGGRNDLETVAGLRDPRTGRGVEIATTQSTVSVTLGDRAERAKLAAPHSVCLSPQNFPDAPNHAHFPSATVDVDRPYSETTIFRFYWDDEIHATNKFAG